MRAAIGLAVLGLVLVVPWGRVSVGQTAVEPLRKVVELYVELYNDADLEHLRQTNFADYLRAQKMIAAADEICHPQPSGSYAVFFDGAPHCGTTWLTSYPPKKLLYFQLGHVHYIALVTVSLVKAASTPGKVIKVDGNPKRITSGASLGTYRTVTAAAKTERAARG